MFFPAKTCTTETYIAFCFNFIFVHISHSVFSIFLFNLFFSETKKTKRHKSVNKARTKKKKTIRKRTIPIVFISNYIYSIFFLHCASSLLASRSVDFMVLHGKQVCVCVYLWLFLISFIFSNFTIKKLFFLSFLL